MTEMLAFYHMIRAVFLACLKEEWFWAIITVVITLFSFIIQMRNENEISRANFVYNISNDFGNNDRILRVYQWLEKCRRDHVKVTNYRKLPLAEAKEIYHKDLPIEFIDIDTYVNHFEVVYVILRSVKMKNIDDLFQQRFLSFMYNPYIQREELFACFGPDENDFSLLKKWLHSIYNRNRFTCETFIDYLNNLTCGKFEFSQEYLSLSKERWPLLYRAKVKRYLINYVTDICNPQCQYGYYEFRRKVDTEAEERKTMRIIRPCKDDAADILALQQKVIAAMPQPEMYAPSSEAEILTALSNPKDYACVQICDGSQIVAFAALILNPTGHQNINEDLKTQGLPYAEKEVCVLDTVFVDPDYRGYGMQHTLVKVLCSWAAMLGKRNISATIHPDNCFSQRNFIANGFRNVTSAPIPKYGSQRYVFARDLTFKDKKKDENGIYTIFPYV